MDGYDLVPNQLEDSVDDGLETLQDLLVRESHVALLDASLGEVCLDSNVHCPLLAVVAEVCLDSVLKVHDTLGVYLPSSPRAVRQLHLPDPGPKDVTEISVERRGAAGVSRAGRALCHAKGVFLLHFIRDEIYGSATAVDDQNGITDLEVEKSGLGAEHGSSLRFGDQSQTVVVLVAQEAGLEGGRTSGSFRRIVPDGGYCEEISDIPLFSGKHLTQRLLQLSAGGLSQLEEIVCRDVDLRLSWRKGREVDRVNISVPREHQLQLEPFHLLHTGLWVAGWSKRIGDVRTPTHHLLVLIVIQHRWDLFCSVTVSQKRAPRDMESNRRTYLLLGMVSRARPFGDDVFPRLVVGRKGKGNARESGPKVNPHDQLCFASTSPLHLHCGVPQPGVGVYALRDALGDAVRVSIYGRRRTGSQARSGELESGIDGGSGMGDQLLPWRHGAGRSPGRIVCIAGRPTRRILVVHGKAGGGRAVTGRRRVGRRAVGSLDEVVIVIWLSGCLILRLSGGAVLASCTETQGLEAGSHEIHKNLRATENRDGGVRREEYGGEGWGRKKRGHRRAVSACSGRVLSPGWGTGGR